MKFVAFEGIDGAGKTTLVAGLASRLATEHPNVVTLATGEFASEIGADLRASLNKLTPYEKALWFASDRALTLKHVTQSSGDSVILWDRYVASAIANRWADSQRMDKRDGRDLLRYVEDVNRIFPHPDLYVWIEIDVQTSIHRQSDLTDSRHIAHVTDGYERFFAGLHGPPIIRIDGSLPASEVEARAYELLVEHGIIR